MTADSLLRPVTDEADIEKKKKAQKKSRRKESALGIALVSPYLIIFALFSLPEYIIEDFLQITR